MKKPLYLLEGRIRKRNGRYVPNLCEGVIGVFTSAQKAQDWIQKEGFYTPHYKKHKNHFYAVVEIKNLNICDGILENFYDKYGNKIYR